ncbi:isoamylase [Amycolatopsis sp. H20-H5]|uniref:isoamylase n=1 Tax=Amycolatopsis sp. H20-H5 TaxID=3046309 RepID=UPI002DBF4E75|nr:isoamylase [Amycolatopsis sp. H20-H5]MEC3981292.1 isoamylase [Amycolatopsis sp. H20-H5]
MITVLKAGNGLRTVRFALPLKDFAAPVSVVGDFNQWRPGAHPLLPRTNGTISALVKIPEGRKVSFRYLGEDGWFDDAEVADREGANCVIAVP